MGMTIDDITDPKCKGCPLNARCMICPYMMEQSKERGKGIEAYRRKKITETV